MDTQLIDTPAPFVLGELPPQEPPTADDFALDLDAPDPILPEGRHAAYIAKAEAVYSKNTNAPMLKMQYVIDSADEWNNARVFSIFMLDAPNVWRFKAFVRSLGFTGPFNAWTDADALQNYAVWLDITHREYEGQTQANVKFATGRDTSISADPPF